MLNFTDFKTQLESSIVRNPYQDSISKPHTRLNRLEHCLIKSVVPFMIIGHCPRGTYFKMKGSVVMISADVTSTLEKILPNKNTLIPVSFKRKLEYKGYYLQEYIDRVKWGLYFQFFRKNNHLYEDYQVGDLEKYEEELCSTVDDKTKDSDSNERDVEAEEVPMSQTSLILDKYSEPVDTRTYANKVGSMIYDYEQFYHIENEEEDEEIIIDDPEENCFPEDDREEFEVENSFLEKLQKVDVALEDDENRVIISELEELFRSWEKKSRLYSADHYCYLVKTEAHLISKKNKLLGLKSNIEELQQLIDSALNEVDDSLKETTKKRTETVKCFHASDDLQDKWLDEILKANAESSSDRIRQFARDQVKQIEKNIQDLITVAPGAGGKFHSWGSDIYLEEKMFPQLFPYGIGGYLSSNLLQGSKMGFANYCKNRILSVNSKFREDLDYLFFLTIVKEQIQLRRSERTYLRKAAKVPSLTPASLSGTNQELLKKANTLYHHVRDLRGSAPYFQDTNKKLMAFLRQKGAPTLFVTLSAAEYAWDDLALKIYETVTNKPSTLEFIRSQSRSWRNKLLHDNVVQSTIHFSKRVEKIIAYLKKNPLLEHNGVKYRVDSHFVRIEFQARGAPHAHMLVKLIGENGEEPPSLLAYSEGEGPSMEDICSSIASFSTGVICGSATEATCENHESFEADCDSCISVKEDVVRYQNHRHKFNCHKKKKRIVITEDQGHGRFDGKQKSVALELKSCRFNFPRNPIDKTEFILGFPEDTDKTTLNKAKADYEKIRKYLLRLTNESDYELSERWQKFVSLSFYEYLYEVGMLESDDWSDVEAQQKARARYLTALRLIFNLLMFNVFF